MDSHGYQEIDHTADLALKVWAEDFHSLLYHALKGMYELMDIELNHNSGVQNTFLIAAGMPETQLVDFLTEALYLVEDKRQAFETFSLEEKEGEFFVNAKGCEVLSIGRSIKAVTFHNLDIEKTETGLEATITFDV